MALLAMTFRGDCTRFLLSTVLVYHAVHGRRPGQPRPTHVFMESFMFLWSHSLHVCRTLRLTLCCCGAGNCAGRPTTMQAARGCGSGRAHNSTHSHQKPPAPSYQKTHTPSRTMNTLLGTRIITDKCHGRIPGQNCVCNCKNTWQAQNITSACAADAPARLTRAPWESTRTG